MAFVTHRRGRLGGLDSQRCSAGRGEHHDSMETTLPISTGLRAAGGLDAYIYNFQLTDPSTGWHYEKRLMIDVAARVGLTWTFP